MLRSKNNSNNTDEEGEKHPTNKISTASSLATPSCTSDALALARLPRKNSNGGTSVLLQANYLPAPVGRNRVNRVSVPASVPPPASASATESESCLEDPRLALAKNARRARFANNPSLPPVKSPRIAEIGSDPSRKTEILPKAIVVASVTTNSSLTSLKRPLSEDEHGVSAPTGAKLLRGLQEGSFEAVLPNHQSQNVASDSVPVHMQQQQIKPELHVNETMRPHLDWIQSQPLSHINLSGLSIWKKIGAKEPSATFEPKFCDPRTFEELIKHKTFYHTKLTKHESQSSRARSNPFERLENGVFQNRAGMKLANIDADLNFFLSDPRRPDGTHVIGSSDILSFVDICGGPGGFSEYLLFRRGFETKGFGITLRNTVLDYDLKEFQAGPLESYEIFYGDSNTGDIYDPANVKSFTELVLLSTDKQGVHLVVADGGVEVKGEQFLRQESMCKQLYLSQFLIALNVLADGGIFVCKLFETNTKFSIDLIYLLHLCFDQITIYKPRMSRPQNSERYIVCLNKRPRSGTDPIAKYFAECHQLMWEWSSNEEHHLQPFDIIELVPVEVLLQQRLPGSSWKTKEWKECSEFCDKMQRYNYTIMKDQCEALKNLRLYANDPLLQIEGQDEMRKKCCEEWRVPLLETRRIKQREYANQEMTDETFSRLWQVVETNTMNSSPHHLVVQIRDLKERKLTLMDFDAVFKSPYDWRVMVVQGNASTFKQSRGFYMSQGGTDVFRYNVTREEWEEAPITIELPKDTLVFGECVQEFEGYGLHQKKIRVFHIIDALVINGKDLCNHHYVVRHEFINKLAKSVSKGSRGDLSIVRAKQLVRMENIADLLNKCEKQELKGEDGLHWTCPIDHMDDRSPVIKAAGILFLKLTKDPWTMTVNERNHRKFWLNLEDGSFTYDFTQLAVSSFVDTMRERTMWGWTEDTILEVPDPELGRIVSPQTDDNNPGIIHSYHFLQKKYSYPRPRPTLEQSQGPQI